MLNQTHSLRVGHSLEKQRVALHPCMRSPIFLVSNFNLFKRNVSLLYLNFKLQSEHILLGLQCVCDALIAILIT